MPIATPPRLHLLPAALLALAGCGAEEKLKYDADAKPVAEAIPAEGVRFRCTPTRVSAGDGPLRCAEGQRVKLAGIAVREVDGRCRANQPCPDASPQAARAALVRLVSAAAPPAPAQAPPPAGKARYDRVSGPALSCTSTGWAGGRRVGAWCVSPVAGDLSCAMVASGTALPWPAYWRSHGC